MRQLWTVLVSARYGALNPGDEEDVHRLCEELSRGIPGFEHFNRATRSLCQRLTSLKGETPHDALRVDCLLNEVDYLRALLREGK